MTCHAVETDQSGSGWRQRLRRAVSWAALGAMLLPHLERDGEPFGEVPYPPGSYMVALGDSITSGEGNPPFEAGTAGACNRSTATSYSQQLATRYGWQLDHRACSGANIQEVQQGRFGEPGQLEALNGRVDIVTITVGVSEVNLFDAFWRCSDGDRCHPETDEESRWAIQQQTQRTTPRLTDLYLEIARRAPRADIFVLTYPMLANPAQGCSLPGYPHMSQMAYQYIEATNQAIKQAASDANRTLGSSPRIRVVEAPQESACQHPFNTVWISAPDNPTGFAHPTEGGHRELAVAVAASMGRRKTSCSEVADLC